MSAIECGHFKYYSKLEIPELYTLTHLSCFSLHFYQLMSVKVTAIHFLLMLVFFADKLSGLKNDLRTAAAGS